MREQDPKNAASEKEQAEGERETVTNHGPEGRTISNRPEDEERNEQVPTRGERQTDAAFDHDNLTLRTAN